MRSPVRTGSAAAACAAGAKVASHGDRSRIRSPVGMDSDSPSRAARHSGRSERNGQRISRRDWRQIPDGDHQPERVVFRREAEDGGARVFTEEAVLEQPSQGADGGAEICAQAVPQCHHSTIVAAVDGNGKMPVTFIS